MYSFNKDYTSKFIDSERIKTHSVNAILERNERAVSEKKYKENKEKRKKGIMLMSRKTTWTRKLVLTTISTLF